MSMRPGDLGQSAYQGFVRDRQTSANLPIHQQRLSAFAPTDGHYIAQDRENFRVFAGHSITEIEGVVQQVLGGKHHRLLAADGRLTQPELALYFLAAEQQRLQAMEKSGTLEAITGKTSVDEAAKAWGARYQKLVDVNGDGAIDAAELAAKTMVQTAPGHWAEQAILQQESGGGKQPIKTDIYSVTVQSGKPKEAAWLLEKAGALTDEGWPECTPKLLKCMKHYSSAREFQAYLETCPDMRQAFLELQVLLHANPEKLAAIPWAEFKTAFPNSAAHKGTQMDEVGRTIMEAQWMGNPKHPDYYSLKPLIAAALAKNPMGADNPVANPAQSIPTQPVITQPVVSPSPPPSSASGGSGSSRKLLGIGAILVAALGLSGAFNNNQRPAYG